MSLFKSYLYFLYQILESSVNKSNKYWYAAISKILGIVLIIDVSFRYISQYVQVLTVQIIKDCGCVFIKIQPVGMS